MDSCCTCRRGRLCAARSDPSLCGWNRKLPKAIRRRSISRGRSCRVSRRNIRWRRPMQASRRFLLRRRSAARHFYGRGREDLAGTRAAECKSDVHQNRFENDRRDLARIFFEAPLDAVEIVKLATTTLAIADFGMPPPPGTELGASGSPYFSRFWLQRQARNREAHGIALQLDDLVATRGGARDAAGVHRRFRAARTEANHLHRKAVADFIGEFPFDVHAACRTSSRRASFCSTAFTTAGWQCPAINAPKQRLKSMYSLPSMS